MRPPTTTQVIPGALVNIVLKADQPTGRTVSGKIQDVLTRGNHPRGIKVRLVDGRVGRVQSMLSSSSSSSSPTSSSTGPQPLDSTVLHENTPNLNGGGTDESRTEGWGSGSGSGNGFGGDGDFSGHSRGRERGRGRGRGPRGRRNDYDDGTGGGYPPEQQALGLDAYIKPARNQRRGGGRGGGGARSMSTTAAGGNSNGDESSGILQETAGESSVCPVCGDFEGDEAAVAHHVAGHFGD